MPSQHFTKFSDRDVSSLITYIKSVPPVDNELPKTKFGPLGRVIAMMASDEFLPATGIDHTAGREEPAPGVSQAYDKYLAEVCSACHASDFAGGPIPGAESGYPESANITVLTQSQWTYENFTSFMRTGSTHYGKQVDNEHMPWKRFRQSHRRRDRSPVAVPQWPDTGCGRIADKSNTDDCRRLHSRRGGLLAQ